MKTTGIAIAVVLGALWLTFWLYGNARFSEGEAKTIASVQTETVKQVKKRNEINRELLRSSDDDLIRRYCHWVYGATYDECVRDYRPVD